MSKKRRVRGSKYTDAFKRHLVAESYGAGVTVLIVSKQHGVPYSPIYSWRGDKRLFYLTDHFADLLRWIIDITQSFQT